jgi:hypothetical protein
MLDTYHQRVENSGECLPGLQPRGEVQSMLHLSGRVARGPLVQHGEHKLDADWGHDHVARLLDRQVLWTGRSQPLANQ